MIKNKEVVVSDLELDKRQNEERRQQEDRREVLQLRGENNELRKENRRLLEDRRGGGSNFFGNLMTISIILFALSLLAYLGIPTYLEAQTHMPYDIVMSYKSWVSVSGIGLWVFPLLSVVFFFLKKK